MIRVLAITALLLTTTHALSGAAPFEVRAQELRDIRFEQLKAAAGAIDGVPVAAGNELTEEERQVLNGLLSAAEEAGKVWPGYDLFSTPFLLVHKGGKGVLIDYPRPLAGYRSSAFRGHSIQITAAPPELPGAIAADERNSYALDRPYEGVSINGVAFSDPVTLPKKGTRGPIALGIHEPFHIFQIVSSRWVFRRPQIIRYPDTQPEDIALAAMEQRALARALDSSDDEARFTFLALRKYRNDTFVGETFERAQERLEGMAYYVERRSLERALGPEFGVSSIVNELRQMPTLEGMSRSRPYLLGSAMAVLLERTGVAWQARIASGSGPFDILFERFPLRKEEVAARVARVKETSEYLQCLNAASPGLRGGEE